MDDSRRQLVTIAIVSLLVGGGYLAYDMYFGSGAPDAPQGQQPEETERSGGSSGESEGKGQGTGGNKDGGDEAQGPSTEQRRANKETATIETEHFVAKFTNRNTGLVSYELKDERYYTEEDKPEQLVTTNKAKYLPLHPELIGVHLPPDAYWSMEETARGHLRFTWSGNGFKVVRKVQPGEGPYQLWATTRIVNTGNASRPVRLKEATFHYIPREEEDTGGFLPGRPSPKRARGVCLWGDGELEQKPRDDLEYEEERSWNPHRHRYPPPEQREAGVEFSGVADVYFANVLAASGREAQACQMWSSGRGGTLEEPHGSLFETRLVYPRTELAAGESIQYRTLAYLGPKEQDALRAAGHGLSRVVDLGWADFIGRYLVELLAFIHDLVSNWGLSIILLTVLVKIILYPLTEKSFRSMARMRQLKPEMDRINELYKDDREKKGAAVMELYRKHKINPLGGCLPTLLQLPIWFALYQSLSTNVELYHAPFLIWPDLSAPDPYFVLPLLVGGTMFLQQRLTPTTMDPTQAKLMMYFMPVMFTGFMLFLPSGLCLYILTNSGLSIAQQQFIQRRLDRQSAGTEPSESPPEGEGGDAARSEAESTPSREAAKPRPKKAAYSNPSRKRGNKRRQRRGRA